MILSAFNRTTTEPEWRPNPMGCLRVRRTNMGGVSYSSRGQNGNSRPICDNLGYRGKPKVIKLLNLLQILLKIFALIFYNFIAQHLNTARKLHSAS